MKSFQLLAILLMIARSSCLLGQEQAYRLSADRAILWVAETNPAISLQVYVGSKLPSESTTPAILGQNLRKGDSLGFRPAFPFRPGKTYAVAKEGKLWFSFSIPDLADYVSTQLTQLYPSADTLPANLLKVYLHFSAPMRTGVAEQYLVLVDEQGNALPPPFVNLQPELWNATGTRLTLWVDPGRVKRALGPNELAGAPLEAGKVYTLRIRREWPDAQGRMLAQDVQKTFVVGPADRESPNLADWQISLPVPETREALEINFGEPLDHALATQTITILDENGQLIPGSIQLSQQETHWTFTPEQVWQSGAYQLAVATYLEDLAGNNLSRLFDRDLFADPAPVSTQKVLRREFEIGGK